MDGYPQTPRTTALRMRERMSYDRAAAHAILDEAWHCTLSFVLDGEPRVLPTLHVRVDDTLYLHGSSGGRMGLESRGGLRVAACVTHLDGLVLARSQFHHSANYRSVIAHGTAVPVTDEAERRRVFTALAEKIAPGHAARTRPPSAKELAQTVLLALPLDEVSVRARTGTAGDDDEDLALPHWAGVLPLRVEQGRPEPAPGVTVPVPDYLGLERGPWHEPVVMRGAHVTLEPLDLAHTDDLFAAVGGDEEVWRWLSSRPPRDRAEMAAHIETALEMRHRGERVPWLQRDSATGEVLGTTSYYAIDTRHRQLGIGHTFLARKAWRTGVNTESKLLLLERAFDVLGCERVEWHTDHRNERSQAAIARLGAQREGVHRHHRLRPDGTWRDTVTFSMLAADWPAARTRLRLRTP
ncbi:bifunctional pyridoxamine 5'-phosphate oxidase family protein/GNAT family N-acetyltransferase [Catellatospora sp. NPDC049609]|uniref:bifunctional pyridoxamine 5'-phosphate oxidase family protein/GNAT family N-acetyltransferase n=1 Tax=Catellatospora sp. NPDC049609 TaxID=3155505 RepID=UPI0034184776